MEAAAAAGCSHRRLPCHAGAWLPRSGEIPGQLLWAVNCLGMAAACKAGLPTARSCTATHISAAAELPRPLPLQLGASLRELSALGMRKNQVSAAILRCPAVTQYT